MIFEENNRKILPKMKKNIGVITLLFFLFSFGNATEHALLPNQEKSINDCLKQIKHIYRPFQTIELSYYCESFDEKIGKWRLIAREEMSWDSSTKNFFNKVIDETPDREKQRECITWNHNNRLFRMHTICEKTPDFRPKQHMKKMESVEIRESYSPDVLGSSATYLMDLHRTLASLNDCR